MSKLSEEFKGTYDFSKPIYSRQYHLLQKSPKLYDAEAGTMVDLDYFKQELRDEMGISIFPKYINHDLSVDDNYYNVLYNVSAKNEPYYVRIDKATNRIISNKALPQLTPSLVRAIDPFDNNYIIQFYDNNKVVRYKIFDE